MRVGQAFATEIGHWVRFAPNNVIQNPVTLILKLCPHTEHVVIAANHPDRAVRLEHTASSGKPIARKAVIGGKGCELIPMIIHRIHFGIVWSVQIAAQLQIIRRVRENKVNTAFRQRIHHVDAIAAQDAIQRKRGYRLLRLAGHYYSASFNRRIFPLFGCP